MKNEPLFAEMPVLSIVTNFSTNGNFERVYLVYADARENSRQNKPRRTKPTFAISNTWNGPLLNISENR
ncbi:MAG TPA: hypothetical protein PKY12_02300 [Catalimonadaceae bacterium]|jgi:hypothetical protein|nr:hypothetical protein [Catalimonadaceae bacterium]